MTYQINDLGDGRCELVEIRTTTLGILTSRRIAERFADWLDAQDEEGLQQLAELELVEPDETDPFRETVFSPGDIPLLDPVPAVPDGIEPASPQEVAASVSGGGRPCR